MARVDPNKFNLEERAVQINRVAKTRKGGRIPSFSTIVVVGDQAGHVGAGIGKAREVPDSIRKGIDDAKKNLIEVPLVDNRTIPHEVTVKFGASIVMLKPASPGTGVIAGGGIRAVLEMAGLKDVLSKSLGNNNPINAVRATIKALESLKIKEEEEIKRGKPFSSFGLGPSDEKVEAPAQRIQIYVPQQGSGGERRSRDDRKGAGRGDGRPRDGRPPREGGNRDRGPRPEGGDRGAPRPGGFNGSTAGGGFNRTGGTTGSTGGGFNRTPRPDVVPGVPGVPRAPRMDNDAFPQPPRPQAQTPAPVAPELNLNAVTAPELNLNEVNAPETSATEVVNNSAEVTATTPEMTTPEVDAPEMGTPEVDAPEMDAPQVDAPEITTPEESAPEMNAPEIGVPEVDVPATDVSEATPSEENVSEVNDTENKTDEQSE